MQLEMVGEVEGVAEMLKAAETEITVAFAKIAELVKLRTIEYLKSLTDEMRPSVRRPRAARTRRAVRWTGPRRAHPGHWADITSQLVNSYGGVVQIQGRGTVILILWNTAEYALYLDRKKGFFVLRGVTDPGGPVEDALEAAVRIIAPDWSVFTGAA